MPESSWPENDSFNELESLSSLLAEFSHLPEPNPSSQPQQHQDRRRRKAAVALVMIWSGTIALHLVTWGYWLVMGVAALMGIHVARILCARPLDAPDPLTDAELDAAPIVSILVAAKNEEAVIGRLVKALCSLSYALDRYELWVIDDNSTDRTPLLLEQLAEEYEQLHVFQRSSGASGGKSGALNQVLPLTRGEIIAVFDADAQITPDLLRQVVPFFERETVGAVQVRKAISNLSPNAWIRGQVAEMALDSYFQQQRIAIGGIGELRGNGQFVRRRALERCGGWNEATITDDLDLTLRLHLDNWDIDFLLDPAVEEEGVTRATALWHQRNRWAEGGYQRYLDYWQAIVRGKLGRRKLTDLLAFWIIQYFLPTAMLPDLMMAIWRSHLLVWSPLTGLSVPLSVIGMMVGLRRIRRSRLVMSAAGTAAPAPLRALRSFMLTGLHALYGTLYMCHWILVLASTTARMSVRPKRLKWVKTTHQGDAELWLDPTARSL